MMEASTYTGIFEQEWDRLMGYVMHHFARREVHERAGRYVESLLSDVRRRNGWQLAEQAGEQTPDGMQRLLNTARWDQDGMRDTIRWYAVQTLGQTDNVLVIDETGFLKKGTHSVGVKRQYSGTAGRIENCQVGVFLVYTTPQGQTLIDRELYLPQEWCTDEARREKAGVPACVPFQTKGALAQTMLERTLRTDLTVEWVTGDSIYGSDRRLRLWLEARQQAFVLGIKSDEALWCGVHQRRAAHLTAEVDDTAWQRLSAGTGSKGPRVYDWLAIDLPRFQQDPHWQHALLVRRSISDPHELSYYVVFAPAATTLEDWVRIAGQRWTIEECFEHAKDELGLDQYEVRRWAGWYRHITLVMLAQVFLHTLRQAAQTVEKNTTPSERLT
jgi:SRSO17 transposase